MGGLIEGGPLKRSIVAAALAAAVLPFMTAGTAGAATSLPPGPAIYPGNGGPLEHVTLQAPAVIYTPWGVIADEYGTGATVPAQYGGTQNGKPIPYPGWITNSTPHVQLNFAILTTPKGQKTVIEYLQNAVNFWSPDGDGVDHPTCMAFTVAATGVTDWMLWSGGSWVNAPGCELPG
jgi:hypothetical protein